jgi:hypothetical protein
MTMGDSIPPELMGLMSRAATSALDAGSKFASVAGWKPAPGAFALPAVGINFIATNVPGVQVAQYLNGHTCLDMVPLVPLGATLGYGVAILSYNRNMNFGMIAEPRVMPDIDRMKSYVDEALEELRARAKEKSAIEGEQREAPARAAG